MKFTFQLVICPLMSARWKLNYDWLETHFKDINQNRKLCSAHELVYYVNSMHSWRPSFFPFCFVTGEVVATTVQDAESSNSIQYATYRYVLVVINEVYLFSCIVISRHFLASAFFLPLVAGGVAQRRNKIRESKVFYFGCCTLSTVNFVCWSRRSVRWNFSHFLIEFFVKNSSHASDFGTFVTLPFALDFMRYTPRRALRCVTWNAIELQVASTDEQCRKKNLQSNPMRSSRETMTRRCNKKHKNRVERMKFKIRRVWDKFYMQCEDHIHWMHVYKLFSYEIQLVIMWRIFMRQGIPKYHFPIRKSRLFQSWHNFFSTAHTVSPLCARFFWSTHGSSTSQPATTSIGEF